MQICKIIIKTKPILVGRERYNYYFEIRLCHKHKIICMQKVSNERLNIIRLMCVCSVHARAFFTDFNLSYCNRYAIIIFIYWTDWTDGFCLNSSLRKYTAMSTFHRKNSKTGISHLLQTYSMDREILFEEIEKKRKREREIEWHSAYWKSLAELWKHAYTDSICSIWYLLKSQEINNGSGGSRCYNFQMNIFALAYTFAHKSMFPVICLRCIA